MIDHLATCQLTTSSWARIDALLLYAGRLQGALRADDAFRLAGRWRSQHAGLAGTDCTLGGNMAKAIGSTRIWLARILGHWRLLATVAERITRVALQTAADRNVIGHIALRILATGARAGIDALLVQTCLAGIAVRAKCALGTATDIGIALVVGQASADAVMALRIGTTRMQITRIIGGYWWLWCTLLDDFRTLDKRISGEACTARADRQMILYATLGVDAARSVTGITALLGNAGTIGGAIGVDHALGSAVGRCSNVVSQARTGRLITAHTALGIETARRWLTWISFSDRFLGLLWCWVATSKWISSHVQWAAADRIVIDHFALGVQTTNAGARIGTAELVTRLVLRALRIHCALRFAVWRISDEVLQARADGEAIGFATFTVRTTWRWQAWIGQRSRSWWFKASAIRERIATVAIIADAVGHMIDRVALGIGAADAWTRILALVSDARLIGGTIRAEHALGSATLIGITLVFIDALAGSSSISLNALGIRSTWRRFTWFRLFRLLLDTLHKGVARIAWWT